MKTKIYIFRVGVNAVVGFAKLGEHGLSTMLLKSEDLSKREIESSIKQRFHAQRHELSKYGINEPYNGFEVVWLDFDEITRKKTPTLNFGDEERVWTLEEHDGHFKPVKVESKLMTKDEIKLEVLKRMGL